MSSDSAPNDPGGRLPEPSEARPELLALLRRLSFRHGKFVLASGKESDFFIDCKQTVLGARGHLLAGAVMFAALDRLPECRAVAGVALGGCPLASAVSLVSELRGRPLPALYVRKEAKDHGTKRLVEGALGAQAGTPVVLLEDVITTGGSTLKAVGALAAAGAKVVGVVVLVDRREGGGDALDAAGMPWVSVFRRQDFIPDATEGPDAR
jgi:orotate phosphoribosyltransferase